MRIALTFTFFLLSICGWCLPIRHAPLPTTALLPTMAINRVMVGGDGYVWYGTENCGLLRDDGYGIACFRSDFRTASPILSNHVTCLAEDSAGHVCFGTKRGLYLVDKATCEVTVFPDEELRTWTIDALAVGRGGDLWVASNHSVFHYAKDLRRLSRTPSKHNGQWRTVHLLHEGRSGRVYGLQNGGGILCLDKGGKTSMASWPFKGHPAYLQELPFTHKLLTSETDGGLHLYDPSKDTYETVTTPDHATGFITMAYDKARHRLWGITGTGVHAYHYSSEQRMETIGDMDSPSPMQPRGLSLDASGAAWVVSPNADSYVFFTPSHASRWISLPHPSTNLLALAMPTSTAIVDGHIYFCQLRQGFYGYDASTRRLTRYTGDNGFTGGKVSPFMERSADGHTLWLVLDNRRIWEAHVDGGKMRGRTLCILPDGHSAHAIARGDDGTLWVGTAKGLCQCREGNAVEVTRKTGPVNCLAVADGCVWVGTESKGLFVYNPSTGKLERHYQPTGNIRKVTVGPDGTAWWATQGGNLYRLPHGGKMPKAMGERIGLTGDGVVNLALDKQGRAWLLTSRRLYIHDPRTEATTVLTAGGSALPLNSLLCLNQTVDGHMVVGGTGGLCLFDAEEKGKAEIGASVDHLPRITSWTVGDSIHLALGGKQGIRLAPNERTVTITVSALHTLYANETRYAYRLDGETAWTTLPLGNNRITLSALSRGSHKLELRCTNADGRWSQRTVSFRIYRSPEWYESTAAFAFYFIVSLVAGYCALHRYIGKKKRRAAEDEQRRCAADVQELVSQITEDVRTAEDDFLVRAKECIERNMTNGDYSVEQLAADLAMERTGLYRKLKALSGQSPNTLIRSMRLQRVARLLEQGHTVSEAAYLSGFSTPKYMSRRFQEEFGITPSDYQKRHLSFPPSKEATFPQR